MADLDATKKSLGDQPFGPFRWIGDPFNQPTELTSHQKNTASVEFFWKTFLQKLLNLPSFLATELVAFVFFAGGYFFCGVLRIFKKKNITILQRPNHVKEI